MLKRTLGLIGIGALIGVAVAVWAPYTSTDAEAWVQECDNSGTRDACNECYRDWIEANPNHPFLQELTPAVVQGAAEMHCDDLYPGPCGNEPCTDENCHPDCCLICA